jgi:hypothetical protein
MTGNPWSTVAIDQAKLNCAYSSYFGGFQFSPTEIIIFGAGTANSYKYDVFKDEISNGPALKKPTYINYCQRPTQIRCVLGKYYVIDYYRNVLIYDTENNKWELKRCKDIEWSKQGEADYVRDYNYGGGGGYY